MTCVSFALAPRAVAKKWSTPRWLWSAMGLSAGLTLVFWVAATTVLVGGQGAVTSVEKRGAPAYISARTAHAALSDADRAAWQSFRSGAAQLIGPGQQFRDDLTTATDNLAHIAELDLGGAAGRDLLRAVNAQVVTYQGMVEQAATYREGLASLGLAYLGYASDLLHGGLLARIDQIAQYDRQAVDDWHGSAWADPVAVLVTGVLGVALLAVLVYVQVSMARRFRRILNPPLLGASVLVLALLVWTTVVFLRVGDAFDDAAGTGLPAVDRALQAQISTADANAGDLRANRDAGQGGLDIVAADRAQRPLKARLADAADTEGLGAGLPLLAVAMASLTATGVWLRLREYWR